MSQKLTVRQKRAITALMETPTLAEAAALAGVNPRTLHRWLDTQAFRAGLSAAEGAAINNVSRRLVQLGDKAVDALESVLDNPNQKGAGNKRLAAQAILDNLLKLRELRSIEERIANLEAVIYEKQQ